jgi:nucleotide-binding universal stress UspA family protein
VDDTKEAAMHKILIATDGSPASTDAVEFGLELASEHDAEAIVVHVVRALDTIPMSGFGMTGAVPHEVTDADRASLDDAVDAGEERGLAVTTKLLVGADTAAEIVAYADSLGVDLIVVGSRGHGMIANALLGSVSRAVLRESRRPVLIVRDRIPDAVPA